MKAKRSRRKRSLCLDRAADRVVKAAVLLAVTLVLLLIGFSGPSVYLTLPGRTGWLYIGVVIVAAAVTLFWLFGLDDKRRKVKPPSLGTIYPRSKRIQIR